MQAQRLFGIVYLLQQKGRMTAGQLAREFEVSVRTIQRDVDALSAAGIPVYCIRGKGGGVGLLPGFVLERSTLTAAEQSQVLMGLQGLCAAGEDGAKTALQKLAGLFRQGGGDWLQVDFTPWGAVPGSGAGFELLKTAILQHRAIRFDYYSAMGQKTTRDAEPVRLQYKDAAWYLQAFCRVRRQMRTFKVCRMVGIQLLSDTFVPGLQHAPPPLEPAGQPGAVVRLRLVFRPAVAYRLYDMFGPEQIAQLPDGQFYVCADWPEDAWVYGTLLSFGSDVLVLGPPNVQRRLVALAAQVQALYPPPQQ